MSIAEEALNAYGDPARESAPSINAMLDAQLTAPLLTAEEQHRLEHFYYVEAALLDGRRLPEWLELFTDDCHYWMPIRQTRLAGQDELEFTKPGEIAYFDDTKEILAIRVAKLQSAFAWGETPPARTRHMVANVRATAVDGDELAVTTNFMFYRSMHEREVDWFVGRRDDVLRRGQGSFKIARRSIFLDQTVILAKNMAHFF